MSLPGAAKDLRALIAAVNGESNTLQTAIRPRGRLINPSDASCRAPPRARVDDLLSDGDTVKEAIALYARRDRGSATERELSSPLLRHLSLSTLCEMSSDETLKPALLAGLQLYLYSDFSSSYAYRGDQTAPDSSLGGTGVGAEAAEAENLEHLGPIIRNIHLSKQQDAFLRHLTKFTEEKEAEIEQVCRTNYQVGSLSARAEAQLMM